MDNKVSDKQRNKQRSIENLKPFKKGKSGNPGGRPPGIKNFKISDLIDAIIEVEEEKKMPLYKKFVNKAYVNSAVMIALIKKLIPDKTHTEIEGIENIEIKNKDLEKDLISKLDAIRNRMKNIDNNISKKQK